MRSLFHSIAILGLLTVVFAVPAPPDLKHVEVQPDGTQITLIQWGDEFIHGLETEDGYTVVKDANGYYVYAVLNANGYIVPSQNRVGIDPPPSVKKHLRPTNEATVLSIKSLRSQIYAQAVNPAGTGKLPVVLINFNNTQAIYQSSDFTNLIFGNSGNSLKDYYREASYNAFTLDGGVFGWYTASQNHDYYGADSQSNPDNKDLRVKELIREAAQLSDPDINFAQYDTDGDCYVDMFAVIHQGRGQEESKNTNDIWSHRSGLSPEYETSDSCPSGGYIKIRDYIIMPETLGNNNAITTIGILAHEYGHALGLPDLYDTDYTSRGIGRWGLMGYGSWNAKPSGLIGSSPAHPSAWSKAKLGWITPQLVYTAASSMVIEPVKNNKNHVFQFIVGKVNEYGEYFLVENRQKIGFDEGLPEEGLLIWHIDESVSNNRSECEFNHGSSSCSTSHYKISLEQADGAFDLEKKDNIGNPEDVFPANVQGSTIDSFRSSTTPSSKFYDGSSSGVDIRNIRRDGDNIVIDVISPGNYPDIAVSPLELDFGVVGIDDEYLSVTMRNDGNYKMKISGIRISDSSIFENNYTSTCFVGKFLAPGESCIVEVKAQNRNNLGAQRGTLTIETDDPDEPSVGVALRSSALPVESGGGCSSVPGHTYILVVVAWLLRRFLLRLTQS